MGGPPGALPSKEKISAGRKEGDDHFKKKRFTPRLRIFSGGFRLVQIRRRGGKGSSFRITRSFLSLAVILWSTKRPFPLYWHTHTHTVCMNL